MDLFKGIIQIKKKLKFDNFYKKNEVIGFSLAEMTVVILVLSIVVAVATPLFTRKKQLPFAAGLPIGTVAIWSGPVPANDDNPISNIPSTQGTWYLCDGKSHDNIQTPDLRNKFVYGSSGAHSIGEVGDSTHSSEDAFTLEAKQLPSHTHTLPAGVTATGPNNATHTHGVLTTPVAYKVSGVSAPVNVYSAAANTTLYYTLKSVASGGNSQSHTHSFNLVDDDTVPSHKQTRGGKYKNMPPYYVLAYIMRTK